MTNKKKRFFSYNYKKNREIAENLTIVMQLGLTMAGCIIFCFFIGLYLDKWLGTKGVFVTVFIVLGVIGGANTAYRQILGITESNKEDEPNKTKRNQQK
jgi:F0F1-type ATP synthase assembly protein I